MGFLQSILGSAELPDEPEPKPTMDLPKESYTVAYPVAVNRSQLAAFQTVIEIERNTPRLDGPGADFILESMREAKALSTAEEDEDVDLLERTRQDAEELIQYWQEQVTDDPGVIFLPIGGVYRLRRMLFMCETRADLESDPFTLPDEFVDAVSLLKRLHTTEDEKESVVVHKDNFPQPSPTDRSLD